MSAYTKRLLGVMVAIAVAFGFTIPFGFWLRSRLASMPDSLFGALLVLVLVGIAAGGTLLLRLRLTSERAVAAGRFHPDMAPNESCSSSGAEIRTGYEMSFVDFRRLVSDPSSQPYVAPLLRDWYRYEIAGQGATATVRSEDGGIVEFQFLHNRIQADPPKQYTIYQRAMDLWR